MREGRISDRLCVLQGQLRAAYCTPALEPVARQSTADFAPEPSPLNALGLTPGTTDGGVDEDLGVHTPVLPPDLGAYDETESIV